jgi:fucose 4-O-acetylase-like acetyltransferase
MENQETGGLKVAIEHNETAIVPDVVHNDFVDSTAATLPSLTPDELQSKTIAWLRFPLILLVVNSHIFPHGTSELSFEETPEFYHAFHYLMATILKIRVPTFFFISGCLFFYGKPFGTNTYTYKLKKRVRSLLVPYVLWNLFFVLIYLAVNVARPGTFEAKFGANLSVSEGLYSIFYVPAVSPFWFLRDLIIACLASPLIFLAIKYLRFYAVVIIGMLYVLSPALGIEEISGFSLICIFFFSFGAYFSIQGKNVLTSFAPLWHWTYVLFPVIALILLTDNLTLSILPQSVMHLNYIIGMIAIWGLVSHGIANGKLRIVPALWSATFFLYASHAIVIGRVTRGILYPNIPHTNIALIAAYVILFMVVVGICVGTYHLLHRFFPRFTAIICGNRT